MTFEPPVMGVQPAELLPESEELVDQADVAGELGELELEPAGLSRAGQRALEAVLRFEGEAVRGLRGTPEDLPEAWRWTDPEIKALMPALESVADRYGVSKVVNSQAPAIIAVGVLGGHVTRSLAAERAYQRARAPEVTPEAPPPPEEPPHVPAPDQRRHVGEPGPEPPGGEPGASLDDGQLAGVTVLLRGSGES